MNIENNFEKLKSKWGSAIVARSQIREFTGGAISPGTMANADSQGAGPEGRFQIGRKTVYPVDALLEWLRERAHSKKPAPPSRKSRRK